MYQLSDSSSSFVMRTWLCMGSPDRAWRFLGYRAKSCKVKKIRARKAAMLSSQRKKYLIELLRREGQIIARDVSEALSVSEDTIRRDLRELAREGVLQRVHGGALPAAPALADFASRQDISTADKVAIGRAAARLVQPGQVVFLDGGTTTAQLARHLAPDLRATVITHSPSIAMELMGHSGVEVIMLGGRLYRHSAVGVGAATIAAIGQVRADIYFMGVTGIHPSGGLATGDFEEACVKRALCAAAAETIVLASPEKLATSSPFQVVPMSAAAGMVVLASTPAKVLAPYRKMGLCLYPA
jgi:DeoR/GlpR family transcriptional regulator of sugar metabolism